MKISFFNNTRLTGDPVALQIEHRGKSQKNLLFTPSFDVVSLQVSFPHLYNVSAEYIF